MKNLLLSLAAACCCSCSVPTHLAEVYYKNGQLAKREFDINPSIGGVHSQKGADGYQADDDNQASLSDVVTGVGVGVASKELGKTSVAQEKTKQVGERQSTARAANARVPTITTPTVDPGTGQVLTPVVTQPAAAVGLGGKGL